MEIKGLNLDSAPLISENKSLRFAKNISVHSSLQSYINEAGFKPIGNIYSNTTDILCGIITTNIGFVAFIKRNTLGYINYYEVTNDEVVLKKSIYAYNLNFDENRPITGDYTYNYKNELIITFTEGISEEANETRIININNPTSRVESSEIHVQLNTSEVSLLNIIPDNSTLEAHLYISTEAIGFLKKNQKVNLRLHAYPFQKFGHAQGRVISISETTIRPQELLNTVDSSTSQQRDSIYLVKVELKQKGMQAYGEVYPFKAGMTFDADIMQEERKLYEWVLEPLYSIKGKL